MSSTTQRRKGGPSSSTIATTVEDTSPPPPPPPLPMATVKRRMFGTSAFDKHWLNMDCCGLVCAAITYGLHLYGLYTVCFVLVPPWMSIVDPSIADNNVVDNNATTLASQQQQLQHDPAHRTLTMWGHFHRSLFAILTVLACISHFYAMTTDPGAVPPDAAPLPDPEPKSNNEEEEILIMPTQKGKRICRKCKSFKPQRAHHCR